MASLVLGVAGGAVGFMIGGPQGAQIGFAVGSAIGSSMTKLPEIQGPRLNDLKAQNSTYGAPIPIYYGTARGTGQVIWSSDLIETEHEEEAGGKGGPSQSVTNYTYSVNCAIGICEGEITGIRRIWANSDLIYDQSTTNLGPTGQSSNIRVYTGSETQVADSIIESYEGTGNVPAHRGLAYVVFENLQLEKYGNRIPNFSFEVVSNGAISTPTHEKLTASTVVHQLPHPFIDGVYLSTSIDNGIGQPYVLHITDAIAQTDRTVNVSDIAASNGSGAICYVDFGIDPLTGLPSLLNEIWVQVSSAPTVAIAFDPYSLALKRKIQPTADIVIDAIGQILFDKASGKVLFSSGDFPGTHGYNALNPLSLIWDGAANTDATNDVFPGKSIAGNNSIALSNYNTFICFFVNGEYVHKETVTPSQPDITYDTLRERYAIYDRSASSKSIFKTFDDGTWTVTEYTPDTVAPVTYGSLNYFPIADKYLFSTTKNIYLLNADTFETEDSWVIFTSSGDIYNAMEIPGMPEYLVAFVTNPSDGLASVPLTDRLSSSAVSLSSIVTDICSRVDLAAGDINVTGLTDNVDGYTVAQQMSARTALDGLQAAFFFDAVESD